MKKILISLLFTGCATTNIYRKELERAGFKEPNISCALDTFESLQDKYDCENFPTFKESVSRCIVQSPERMLYWATEIFGGCGR